MHTMTDTSLKVETIVGSQIIIDKYEIEQINDETQSKSQLNNTIILAEVYVIANLVNRVIKRVKYLNNR